MKVCDNKLGINSKYFSKYLESLIIELDEEDRKVLPKWRVKCIDLLNLKIKESLIDYQVKRLGYDMKEEKVNFI